MRRRGRFEAIGKCVLIAWDASREAARAVADAMPLLAAIFSIVGLYGAQLIGVQLMGVDRGVFWSQMQDAVELRNVYEGLAKSLVFGLA